MAETGTTDVMHISKQPLRISLTHIATSALRQIIEKLVRLYVHLKYERTLPITTVPEWIIALWLYKRPIFDYGSY